MTSSVKPENAGGKDTPASTPKRTKSYESRKIRKPIMEKRRRARINESLNELKRILLEANGTPTKKEGNRPAKLEKADILELTVRHLQSMHTNPTSPGSSSSNNINKSSVTSTSDTDDETSSSISSHTTVPSAASPSLETNNHHHNNNNIETPFIHGFAECIRLVQSSMKSFKSGQIPKALEDKLKSHLADLHQISMSENNKTSDEMRHPHDCRTSPMTIDDHDDHMMTLNTKSPPASPASFSQMSPLLISNKTNSSSCEGINRAILIPTRMNNGELAFVLKYPDNSMASGFGCLDIDIPFDHQSFGRVIKTERNFPGFTSNHMDIDNHRGVWRPW